MAGFKPTTSLLQGVSSTTVLQLLPDLKITYGKNLLRNYQVDSKHLVKYKMKFNLLLKVPEASVKWLEWLFGHQVDLSTIPALYNRLNPLWE